jgi:ubiquitin C-terminal hydrolase
MLDGDERPTCEKCKKRRKSTKRLAIHRFPPILVLHIKRFLYNSYCRDKLTTSIDFPLESLDLSPYGSGLHLSTVAPIYDLYAVSNHIGSLAGGHYTAHCRNVSDGKWYTFNDSMVSPMNESSLCGPVAYVLFYKLRGV